MKIRTNILISAIVSIILIVITVNIPIYWLNIRQWFGQPLILSGVGYTDVATTDKLSDWPVLYNANNLLFDNGKIDVGTTSVKSITTLQNLVTVGALSSGSLTTGFTAVNVAQGGTGSTTLSQFNLLLGSSTNAIGIVSGLGTLGQFLTSQGSGKPPYWTTSSVDLGLDYAWIGYHSIIGVGKGIFATNASSTNATTTTSWAYLGTKMNFNGLVLTPPTVITSSSTALMTNASGILSFNQVPHVIYSNPQYINVFNTNASTTLMNFVIPGGLMATSSIIQGNIDIKSINISSGANRLAAFSFYYGSQSSSFAVGDSDGSGFGFGDLSFQLMASTSPTEQVLTITFNGFGSNTDGISNVRKVTNFTVDSNSPQLFKVEGRMNVQSTGDFMQINNSYAEYKPYWLEN